MTILYLNDPMGLKEISYSDNIDTVYGVSNSAVFTLDGNDTITSTYYGENQIAVGGKGDDTYVINTPGILTIFDNGTSSNDTLEATGIGVTSPDTFFATIDERHLFVYDSYSGQNLIVWIIKMI